MPNFSDDQFQKPLTNIFKFTKKGDRIKGTLTEVGEFTGDFGTCKKFTVKALEGFYHPVDEKGKELPQEKLKVGELYTFLGKKIFEEDLAKAKIGQLVLVEYTDDGMSKKFKKPYKQIVAKLGPMDPEFKDDLAKLADMPF
jgi:hypothetical protein